MCARIFWVGELAQLNLRDHFDIAELVEVMIKSEGLRYAEPFNYSLAGAIGKAPVLVSKALEYLPSQGDVRRR